MVAIRSYSFVALVCLFSYTLGQSENTTLEVPRAPDTRALPPSAASGPVAPSAAGAIVPVAGVFCTNDSTCKVNEVCNSSTCVCKQEYVAVNGICKLAAKHVGGLCEDNIQCTFFLGGRSRCDQNRCVCDQGNVPINNGTNCILLKVLEESCSHQEQCNHIEHAQCFTDVCLCKSTHVNDGNATCLPVVNNFEGSCTLATQCQRGRLGPGTNCVKTGFDQGKCVCLNSYFYDAKAKKCLLSRGIDEPCDGIDTGCYLPLDLDNQGIECKKSKCQCKKGRYLSEDRQQCSSGFINHGSVFFIIFSLIVTRRW